MLGAIERLFHKEFEEKEAEVRAEISAKERRTMMNRLITEKGWDPQDAASFLGLTM